MVTLFGSVGVRTYPRTRVHRELKILLTRELGIVMRGAEMRRLVDAFDTNEVAINAEFHHAPALLWKLEGVSDLRRPNVDVVHVEMN